MVMTKSSSSSRGLEDVPPRAALSAKYPSTFAYATIKDRSECMEQKNKII